MCLLSAHRCYADRNFARVNAVLQDLRAYLGGGIEGVRELVAGVAAQMTQGFSQSAAQLEAVKEDLLAGLEELYTNLAVDREEKSLALETSLKKALADATTILHAEIENSDLRAEELALRLKQHPTPVTHAIRTGLKAGATSRMEATLLGTT